MHISQIYKEILKTSRMLGHVLYFNNDQKNSVQLYNIAFIAFNNLQDMLEVIDKEIYSQCEPDIPVH